MTHDKNIIGSVDTYEDNDLYRIKPDICHKPKDPFGEIEQAVKNMLIVKQANNDPLIEETQLDA